MKKSFRIQIQYFFSSNYTQVRVKKDYSICIAYVKRKQPNMEYWKKKILNYFFFWIKIILGMNCDEEGNLDPNSAPYCDTRELAQDTFNTTMPFRPSV